MSVPGWARVALIVAFLVGILVGEVVFNLIRKVFADGALDIIMPLLAAL